MAYLGSFTGGLFQGFSTALNTYAMIQTLSDRASAAQALQDVRDQQMQAAANQNVTGLDLSGGGTPREVGFKPPTYDAQGNYTGGTMPAAGTPSPSGLTTTTYPGMTGAASAGGGTGDDSWNLPTEPAKPSKAAEKPSKADADKQAAWDRGFLEAHGVGPQNWATGDTNKLATGAAAQPAPLQTQAPDPNTASQTLTMDQRTGKAPLPVVRPDIRSNFGGTPSTQALPTQAGPAQVSPTQMQTYDVPPQAPGAPAPAPTAAQPPPALPPGYPSPNTAGGGAAAPAPTSLLQRPSAITNQPVGATLRGATTPGPGAQAEPPSLGGRIAQLASAISPIGTAQAAEAPPPGATTTPPPAAEEKPAAGVTTPPTTPAEAKPGDKAEKQTPEAPGQVAVSGKGAAVAPNQQGPSQQSEKAPPTPPAPSINPSHYDYIQKNDPEMARMIDDAVAKYPNLVTREQVAAHIMAESRANRGAGTGDAGEVGVMQITPATWHGLGIPGDPRDLRTNIEGGTKYLAQLGEKWGPNSLQANLAYVRGDKGVEELGRDAKAYWAANPKALANMQVMYGNTVDFHNQANWKGLGQPHDPAAIVRAAQYSPDQMLFEVSKYGPPDAGLSTKWLMAQSALERMAIHSGNIDALPHIQEYIAQASHQGALSNLAQAYQMLASGNGQGAIAALAKAHAFFPDGTFARFGVNKQDGSVWAEQYSEATHQTIGKPFQITPEAIQMQMLQLQNPANYLDTLQKLRKGNAEIDLAYARAKYYHDRPEDLAAIEEQKQKGRMDLEDERARNRQALADQKAAMGGEHVAQDEADRRQVTKAIGEDYTGYKPSKAYPSDAPEALGTRQAQYDTILRRGARFGGAGMDAHTAREAAGNLTTQKWHIEVKDPNNPRLVDDKGGDHGYIAPGAARQLIGGGSQKLNNTTAGQQAAIGAGMGTQMAALSGLNVGLGGAAPAPMQALQQPATMAA